MTENNNILTFEEARNIIKVSKAKMRSLLSSGEIAAFKVGTYGWRIPQSSINTYIDVKMKIRPS